MRPTQLCQGYRVRWWTSTVYTLQVHCELNLPSYQLDNYYYRTVWEECTSGFTRRERTLRDKSDSCSNQQLWRQAQYIKHALWSTTHRLWYHCSSWIFRLRLWPLRRKRCSLWTNLWNNTVCQNNLPNATVTNKTPVQEACDRADPALTRGQKSALSALLNKHSEAFSASAKDLRRTNLIYHTIDIGDSGPVRQGMRRIPPDQIGVLKAKVDELQSARMVEPSCSPFASPTILVKKKDGSWRLCIDYRKLNSVTKKDAHPLPRIKDIFDARAGSKFFTTLDLAMGYHQIEVHPDDREKTTFSTPFGLFQYTIMPFGLATAPATFMRLMTIVSSGMLYSTCLAYLDDIIIFGRTFDEHLERLDLAIKRLRNANLKLKPSKCSFGQRLVTFLGHIISDIRISTDPARLKRIQEWPQLRNQGEMQSFLGYATY